MTPDNAIHESFEDFKNSFAYGSRNDLNFKFLKGLSDEDAAQFFQDLLWKLGDTLNDGDLGRLVDHVCEWQSRGYSGPGHFTYDEGPFTPLRKPLSESRLALLTSTGHFVEGDDPEPFGIQSMSQEEATKRIGQFLQADPTLSAIPMNTPRERQQARHGGYDIRGVQADPNVALPLERLVELERDGVIGELASEAYSFMGACSQIRLTKHTAPQWVEMFQQEAIDVALLVPV